MNSLKVDWLLGLLVFAGPLTQNSRLKVTALSAFPGQAYGKASRRGAIARGAHCIAIGNTYRKDAFVSRFFKQWLPMALASLENDLSAFQCTWSSSIWPHDHRHFFHFVPGRDLKQARIGLISLDVRERVGRLAKSGIGLGAFDDQLEIG